MQNFAELQLTAAHRPTLLPRETISVLQKEVGLYEGKVRLQEHDSGVAFVTTHRLLWVDDARDTGLQLPLSIVQDVDSAAGIWKASSPKITLTLAGRPGSGSARLTATAEARATLDGGRDGSSFRPWTCEICAQENTREPVKCELCGVQRTVPPNESIDASASADGRSDSPVRSQKRCPACTFLNHAALPYCEMCQAPLPADRNDSVPNPEPASPSIASIKLSFRNGGMSEFLKALKASLVEKAWERDVPEEKPLRSAPLQPSPGLGGITSIIRSVEQSNQRTGDTLGEAFTDLDALMAKAADMVRLAEDISTKLAQTSTPSGDESSEMVAFRSYLIDLGISSPVTKKSTGNLYTKQLTRQLADFLEKVLAKHGGMIALTDLYCLFNRARGTALISPNDLRTCCNTFEELRLPYRVRKFDSGLLVVQSSNHRDEEVIARVHAHVRAAKDGLQAQDLATLEHVSVVLAAEQLSMAESHGVICRDDTIEGLRFFHNIMVD
ncbi:EAP30/Vps36 family-domain-containing protein [Fimicolochytrium jonesii]|uniref:EAP30/Vps36 family-domain-containing protein n=1 Tax=Fimicolochytrium jonesii TaxID=1396493 RepID=UPI0022FEE985|nr:EAP30/Vps36 family-domain-containing protein [Fimicolochytrium jonesii]KAI8824178.1 EAP30/Vps36 family-domain-containing protein [Fimicolochytrium jonesii]